VASHPSKDRDRLCSRATLDRDPLGTSRPLEERGRTHHELPVGPASWRSGRRLGAFDRPAPEGAPSPTLSLPRAFGSLPTRQVVVVGEPHPPVQLVTVAARGSHGRPCRPCPPVPVAPHLAIPHGQQRSIAHRPDLRHRRGISANRSAGTPSKLGTAGPQRGHIRATNDRITADNNGP
jgi:hypothetical protein